MEQWARAYETTQDFIIESVVEYAKGYELHLREPQETKGCTGWILPKDKTTVAPVAGDSISLYGGWGLPIRGAILNGTLLWYETQEQYRERALAEQAIEDAEKKAKYEAKGKAENDAKIQKLPLVFQARIGGFRLRNPDFGWKNEKYELFVLEQAAVFAEALKTPEAIKKFYDLPWEEQLKTVPGMSEDHSGNTFGAACKMATLLLQYEESNPDYIINMHGALCPLVGCKEYGCFAASVKGNQ